MKKFTFFAAVLFLSLACFADAGIVTHQFAKPEETIMLMNRWDDKEPRHEIKEFLRNRWDGYQEQDNYRIPEGKALVITDVDFAVGCYVDGDCRGGDLGRAFLSIENLNSKSSTSVAYLPFRYGDYTVEGGTSISMGTGIIVHYGSKITAHTTSDREGFYYMYLRGYLVNVPKGK